MAGEMRSAHDLHPGESQTHHAHRSKRPPRTLGMVAPEQPKHGQKAEKCGRMARGKAASPATIDASKGKVPHIACTPAKLLQIPRATGQRGEFKQRDASGADPDGACQPDAFAPGGMPPGPHGPPNSHNAHDSQENGRVSNPFVQYDRQPIVVLERKTLLRSIPV